MSPGLSTREFASIRDFIREKCGIEINEDKSYLIESRLSKLLVDLQLSSFEELNHLLSENPGLELTEMIIDAITTNETLWFRDQNPWEILNDLLLPGYIQEIRTGRRSKVRIWSAACSTGQEPYSIAMTIDRYLTTHGIRDIAMDRFEILATDISQEVLDIARLGRYDAISIMRGLEDYYKNQYFINQGRIWTLEDRIKKAVRFQKFNLQNSFLLLGKFDLIFCRYVLIYFAKSLQQDIISKMGRALEPAGILILGSSELLMEDAGVLDIEQHKNGSFFRKR
jgi:chemotaxis protein methyltransferase CheR